MMAKLFDAFFGCWHSHYSFPMTVRKSSRSSAASKVTGTYVVCLDCGKELPYDWKEMKIMDRAPKFTNLTGSLAAKQAA